MMSSQIVVLLNEKSGRKLVENKCQNEGLKVEHLEDLISAVIEEQDRGNRLRLWNRFDEIFDDIEVDMSDVS